MTANIENEHDDALHAVVTALRMPRGWLRYHSRLRRIVQETNDQQVVFLHHGLPSKTEGLKEVNLSELHGTRSARTSGRAILVCVAPHPFEMGFLSVLPGENRQSDRMSLLLRGSWHISSPCQFLASFALLHVWPDQPLTKECVEAWIKSKCTQEVGTECRQFSASDLIDKHCLHCDYWKKRLTDWLVPFGLGVDLIEVRLEEADVQRRMLEEERERQLANLRADAALRIQAAEIQASKRFSALQKRRLLKEIRLRRAILPLSRESAVCPSADVGTLPERADRAWLNRYGSTWEAVDCFSMTRIPGSQRAAGYWLQLPALTVLYLWLLIPTPIVVFCLWQWRELRDRIARGHKAIWCFGGVGSVGIWAGKLLAGVAWYVWPRCNYCGDSMWKLKSLWLCPLPVIHQLNVGASAGIKEATSRWADAVLSLAEAKLDELGLRDFFASVRDLKRDRSPVARALHLRSEHAPPGMQVHAVVSEGVAVALASCVVILLLIILAVVFMK